MPLPPAHRRVTIQGTLSQVSGSGSDIFDFGFASMDALSDEALATALAQPVRDGFIINGVGLYATAHPVTVRVETIAASGKVVSSYGAPIASGQSGLNSGTTATFLSGVVTLETGLRDSKGTKVRGRFYPPACFSGVVGSACDPSSRDAYAEGWASFLHSMNQAGAVVAVASSTSTGLVPCTGITVDNIVDSQRSRKNRVISQRSAVQTI